MVFLLQVMRLSKNLSDLLAWTWRRLLSEYVPIPGLKKADFHSLLNINT